ncbi:MAG: hypothetical protein LPJ98_03295 [Cyclobacteriaceae bacterium]|nr:hypothetical protein [Cyclobacteriaceae bacterium]
MAKNPTFPTLVEDLPFISIQALKNQGLLNPGVKTSGIFNLLIDKKPSGGRISVFLDLTKFMYINLDWYDGKKNHNISITLNQVHSNLGKGKIFYFLCPKSGQKCSKLYFIGHSVASAKWLNLYYKDQILSKKSYAFLRLCKAFFEVDELIKEFFSLKKHSYRGKLTRRAKQLQSKIDKKRRLISELQEFTNNHYQDEFETINVLDY